MTIEDDAIRSRLRQEIDLLRRDKRHLEESVEQARLRIVQLEGMCIRHASATRVCEAQLLQVNQRLAELEPLLPKLAAVHAPDGTYPWYPIATVPHGPCPVLLYAPDCDPVVCYWHGTYGWLYGDCSPLKHVPTHWMPVPDPPAKKE